MKYEKNNNIFKAGVNIWSQLLKHLFFYEGTKKRNTCLLFLFSFNIFTVLENCNKNMNKRWLSE